MLEDWVNWWNLAGFWGNNGEKHSPLPYQATEWINLASQCKWSLHSQVGLSVSTDGISESTTGSVQSFDAQATIERDMESQCAKQSENFGLRAAKNSLPTKQNLVKRKVLTNDYCDHCKMQQEDTLHALYLSPKLEEIWFSVQAWNQHNLQ